MLACLALVAACTSKSTTEQLCDRMDDCNLLAAGYSIDECVDDLDAAAAQLSSNQRDELEFGLQSCLDHPSCNGFGSCIDDYLAGS